jgi:hypothetical protein
MAIRAKATNPAAITRTMTSSKVSPTVIRSSVTAAAEVTSAKRVSSGFIRVADIEAMADRDIAVTPAVIAATTAIPAAIIPAGAAAVTSEQAVE